MSLTPSEAVIRLWMQAGVPANPEVVRGRMNSAWGRVADKVTCKVTQGQVDALTSLVLSLPGTNHTLEDIEREILSPLNQGHVQVAAQSFQCFCLLHGHISWELMKLRNLESALFLSSKKP